MSRVQFEQQIRAFAQETRIPLVTASPNGARLLVKLGHHFQHLFIVPQNADWESPCPTIIAGSDPENIPTALLIELLLDNATNARGSWCLEQAGGKAVVTFMHRFPAELLTAEEFVKICSTTVTVVESFEWALREKVQEAWMNHAGQCGRFSDQAP